MKAPAFDDTDVERFWRFVDKNGPLVRPELGPCWVWTGSRNKRPNGDLSYGVFTVARRHILAHRFAFATEHGELPTVVCHECDNVSCVRSSHLKAGTQATNLADMRAKGRASFNRFPTGVHHPNAKATPQVVAEIHSLRASGSSLAKIGAAVGLHPSTVHDIVQGKTWRQS